MEKLPKKPDELSFKLLVRCRLMLSHALSHYEGGSEIDRLVAVQGFDNSIEYLLRVIVYHLEIEQRTGKSFDIPELANLAGSINKFLKDEYNIKLPYIGELKIFRQIRNLVQHAIVDPKPELNRIRLISERFFEHVLITIFGIKISEIKTSFLIDNSKIKSFLKSAETNFEMGKYFECIKDCRNAFENAYYNEIKDSDITVSLLPAVVETSEKSSSTLWSFLTIIDELEYSRLKINTQEFRKFRNYLDHIPNESGHIVMQREWERGDALFCYEFAANTILIWQSNVQPPIYDLKYDSTKNYVKEYIHDIKISRKFEGRCTYSYDDDNQMELWYLPKSQKNRIERLKIGNYYLFKREVYQDGKSDGKYEAKIRLTGKHSTIVTHEPERWQVIISYIVIDEQRNNLEKSI